MTTNFNDVTAPEHCPAYLDAANVNAIDLAEAVAMTKKFKITMSGKWPYQKTKGFFIPTDSITNLLAQNDGRTTGLKIYLGENNSGGSSFLELIIIATNEVKDDLGIPQTEAEIAAASSSVMIGDTRPCPVNCGKANVLNQD
jgi:hypothetical protein